MTPTPATIWKKVHDFPGLTLKELSFLLRCEYKRMCALVLSMIRNGLLFRKQCLMNRRVWLLYVEEV